MQAWRRLGGRKGLRIWTLALDSMKGAHLSAEAVDDHAHGSLHVDAPLLEVEQLVLANLGG